MYKLILKNNNHAEKDWEREGNRDRKNFSLFWVVFCL